jgi:molecular chaperone DnaK
MSTNRIVGIDLGTTNSGVAIVEGGAPRMLPHGTERIIPSVVAYTGAGQWLVGTPARNQYVYNPDNTVRSIKRHMGTAYRAELAGRAFTPAEISAFILRELKQMAEHNLGGEVSDAVITVPAYFADAARQATQDAGRIAGFNVRRIINEPTAAALAYGLNKVQDQLALVYDLGGGTFDVSLVEMMDGVVEVRATHGDTRLGGDDFDERLANLLAEVFEAQHGIDLHHDRRAWARLMLAAENAKIELSSQPFTWVREEYLTEKNGVALHLEHEVSRHDFQAAISDLLDKTIESVEHVLKDGKIDAGDLDQVLMVGGSSRIPAVWELVANYLDTEPQMTINPEEAVALGAGVQAAIIAGQPVDAVLVDVTPHSLGIAVAESRLDRIITDRYKVLIRRNSTIPTSKAEVFHTLFPDQDTIKIQVYQGEKPVASNNTLLGAFLITDLEPETPGDLASVTVAFDMDVNGILHASARDRVTGRTEAMTLQASARRMSETEILEAREWAEEQPDAGAKPLVLSEITDEQAALFEQAQKLLTGGELVPDDQVALETLLNDIDRARAADDTEAVDTLFDELVDLLFDLEA